MFIINHQAQELKELILKVNKTINKNIDVMDKNSKILSRIHKNLVKFNRFQEINEETREKVDGYHEAIAQVSRTNESVEETICNIWLAIKQNEYLKAWIPNPTKLGENNES